MAETDSVLRRLHRNAQLSAYAHFGASERMSRLHLWFGIPTAAISIILGSVFVADLQKEVPDFFKWMAGALSLIAALLSSLQTFFNASEGKSRHREIANRYLAVNRAAELVLAEYKDEIRDLAALAEAAREMSDRYNQINDSANDFPTTDKDYERAKRKIGGLGRHRDQTHEQPSQ